MVWIYDDQNVSLHRRSLLLEDNKNTKVARTSLFDRCVDVAIVISSLINIFYLCLSHYSYLKFTINSQCDSYIS